VNNDGNQNNGIVRWQTGKPYKPQNNNEQVGKQQKKEHTSDKQENRVTIKASTSKRGSQNERAEL